MKPPVVHADPVLHVYVKPIVAQNVQAVNIEREPDIERNDEIVNFRTNALDLQYAFFNLKTKNAVFHLSFITTEIILITNNQNVNCLYQGNSFSAFFILWIVYDVYNFLIILFIEKGVIIRSIIHNSRPQEYNISLQKYVGLHVFVNLILTSGVTAFYLYYRKDVCYGTIGLYINISLIIKLSIYYFRLFLFSLIYLRYKKWF